MNPTKSNGIRIVKARNHDLAGLLQLYRHLHPEDAEPSKRRSIWAEILGDRKIQVLLAKRAGLTLGTCVLIIIPNLSRGGRPYAVIENVVTHAEHRRKGIGKALLRHAIAAAKAKGCYKVMLMTGSKRKSVHRFYERAGFKKGIKTGFIMKIKYEI